MADVIPFRLRPRPAASRLAPMDQLAVRAEIEEAAQAALDAADHLIAILDGMEPGADDEDGGDAEPDLGAPEGPRARSFGCAAQRATSSWLQRKSGRPAPSRHNPLTIR